MCATLHANGGLYRSRPRARPQLIRLKAEKRLVMKLQTRVRIIDPRPGRRRGRARRVKAVGKGKLRRAAAKALAGKRTSASAITPLRVNMTQQVQLHAAVPWAVHRHEADTRRQFVRELSRISTLLLPRQLQMRQTLRGLMVRAPPESHWRKRSPRGRGRTGP